MAAGDDYRIKAADLNAKAKREIHSRTRSDLEGLALAYLRLADQADRNSDLAPWTEQPLSSVHRQQQQQQRQPQNKTEADKE